MKTQEAQKYDDLKNIIIIKFNLPKYYKEIKSTNVSENIMHTSEKSTIF